MKPKSINIKSNKDPVRLIWNTPSTVSAIAVRDTSHIGKVSVGDTFHFSAFRYPVTDVSNIIKKRNRTSPKSTDYFICLDGEPPPMHLSRFSIPSGLDLAKSMDIVKSFVSIHGNINKQKFGYKISVSVSQVMELWGPAQENQPIHNSHIELTIFNKTKDIAIHEFACFLHDKVMSRLFMLNLTKED